MENYVDFAVQKAVELLAIDSPTGYTAEAEEFVLREFRALGFAAERTAKGGILIDLGGESTDDALLLEAHADTLGGMVAEIKGDGRLRIVNVGGMNANNAEAENCRVVTKFSGSYEGTLQLINASVHVNGDYASTKRSWDTVEVVLDEAVESADDVKALGISVGDFVCFEPRTRGHAAAQRLVKRMEANAFLEALYNANYERLYIYAENLLFNAAYAEEAVQETFFEAVRKQDALMRHAKPEAWLMETLKNKIRVGSRRRALEALYFISLEQDLAQESKKLAVEDRPFGSINELLDAIRALLPPEDYRLLCRITLEGATHLEVAKELGISVWSSQKRLQRIRKKLCKQLLPNKSKKISENMSVLRF